MTELKPCPKCNGTNLGRYEIKAGYGEIVCENCGFTYPQDVVFCIDMMTPTELIEGWNGLRRPVHERTLLELQVFGR